MKTILHLLNTGEYSGAENVAITIISNYTSEYRGIYMSPRGTIGEIVLKAGIEYRGVDKLSKAEIKAAIEEIQPDVIHAHDFTASVLATSVAKGIPVISHLHNNVPWMKKISVKSLLYHMCIRRISRIVTVSDSVIDECWYRKTMQKKGSCIGNPLDLNRIRGQKKDSIESNLLFVGRLTEQKNPLEFLQIVKELKASGLSICARMLGRGELEAECRTYISANQLEDCVTMHGFVNNPYDYMQEGTILVLPSRWEGFGLVAVEAFALSVPVVANPVGGLPGIVTQESGLLSADIPKKVEEISRLLSDEEYYKQKSVAAEKRAEALENIHAYMESIYSVYK